jgi:CheY-like chemotaxis protein
MSEEQHRVLIVDDEPVVRSTLSRLLRHHDFAVSTAVDGPHALKRLREGEAYDCVILDLLLPGMSGREFVQVVAEEELYPLQRVLVLTAVQSAENATAYLQFGCAGYLTKPYDNQILVGQVCRVCAGEPRTPRLEARV